MSYRLTPEAQQDIREIADKIAVDDPRAAERLVEAFRARWRLLASHPYSGRPRDDVAPALRQALVEPYVCYYVIAQGDVEIIRVIHLRRDVSAKDFGA